ncbi:hypothetical protein OG417_15880 [Actinoallomurus sp. NBC_01490]|jgi:hypothetical protein|uniref:hypothetical protein n=1 Tax=Actinoallomurus sp. NBC_01490 TaxID=2903557 RepID=UPI002E37FDB7|nr:hypothetical protein [Actinoallomurus sp. NBC_01490]
MNEQNEVARGGPPEPPERTGLTTGHDETDDVRAKAAGALQIALDRRDNGGSRNDPPEGPGRPE